MVDAACIRHCLTMQASLFDAFVCGSVLAGEEDTFVSLMAYSEPRISSRMVANGRVEDGGNLRMLNEYSSMRHVA